MSQFPFNTDDLKPRPSVFSVSKLQYLLRRSVEQSFGHVMVEGEVSSLTIYHRSGHAYFSLKDKDAVLRCVMWRDQVRRLRFPLEEGQQVICTGKVTVYERDGKLQMAVTRMELQGVGALQAAYRELAEQLRSEGLTEPANKKAIPLWPKVIGVVSSLQAAALRDILRTIDRRNHLAHVIISPTPVQGKTAASQIAEAIERLDRLAQADVIIVARGGGSVEDLWCFNEEVVARSIARCNTPIITGIGHETDRSIADLVADRAASTPTAAAELSARPRAQVTQDLHSLERSLQRAFERHIQNHQQRLHALREQLQDPRSLMQRKSQRFDELQHRAERALRDRISSDRAALSGLKESLIRHSPQNRLLRTRAELDRLMQRQDAAIKNKLKQSRLTLGHQAQRLDLLSPLSILGRGYSITSDAQGRAIRKASEVQTGDKIQVRLHRGHLLARVETLDHS